MSSQVVELQAPASLAPSLLKDETELLMAYRKAKRMGFADLAVTVQEGARVKLWITEKMR